MLEIGELNPNKFAFLLNDNDRSELSGFMSHLSPSKKTLIWKSVHLNKCLIGSFWVESFEDKYFIGLFVLSAHRGSGLGKKLMTLILDDLETRGINQVYLNVRVENLRAISLYESVGFIRTRHYRNSLNILCFQYMKTLTEERNGRTC